MRSSDLESNFNVALSLVIPLAKNNIEPENRGSQKEVVFQPSFFMCYFSFR